MRAAAAAASVIVTGGTCRCLVQKFQSRFMLLEDDAGVVAAEAEAVAEAHLDVALLLLARTHHRRVHALLRTAHVDGGVHPACKHNRTAALLITGQQGTDCDAT